MKKFLFSLILALAFIPMGFVFSACDLFSTASIDLRINEGKVQWAYSAEDPETQEWQDIILTENIYQTLDLENSYYLDDTRIELRMNEGVLQWKFGIKENWNDLDFRLYIVEFIDSQDQSVISTQYILPDSTTIVPKSPLARDGYVFSGWTVNGEVFDFETGITHNVTIQTKWDAIFTRDGSTITGLTTIGETFSELTFPEKMDGVTLTAIGDNAFKDNDTIEKIIFSNKITKIGESAFYNVDSLEYALFNDETEINEIGDYAFYGCASLNPIIFPDTITKIGLYSYADCPNWTNVYITDIDAWFSVECYKETPSADLPSTSYDLYLNTSSSISIPENNYDPANNSKITTLTIPEDLATINNYLFFGCKSITTIFMPKDVTTIGQYAFSVNTTNATITQNSYQNIYYYGTKTQFSKISIGTGNDDFEDASVHYYSETAPTQEGSFWHFNGTEIAIWPPFVDDTPQTNAGFAPSKAMLTALNSISETIDKSGGYSTMTLANYNTFAKDANFKIKNYVMFENNPATKAKTKSLFKTNTSNYSIISMASANGEFTDSTYVYYKDNSIYRSITENNQEKIYKYDYSNLTAVQRYIELGNLTDIICSNYADLLMDTYLELFGMFTFEKTTVNSNVKIVASYYNPENNSSYKFYLTFNSGKNLTGIGVEIDGIVMYNIKAYTGAVDIQTFPNAITQTISFEEGDKTLIEEAPSSAMLTELNDEITPVSKNLNFISVTKPEFNNYLKTANLELNSYKFNSNMGALVRFDDYFSAYIITNIYKGIFQKTSQGETDTYKIIQMFSDDCLFNDTIYTYLDNENYYGVMEMGSDGKFDIVKEDGNNYQFINDIYSSSISELMLNLSEASISKNGSIYKIITTTSEGEATFYLEFDSSDNIKKVTACIGVFEISFEKYSGTITIPTFTGYDIIDAPIEDPEQQYPEE